MKRIIRTSTAAFAVALVGAPAAMGQDAATTTAESAPMQEATPDAATGTADTAYTDAELEQFTRAALRVQEIQSDATITDKATAMQEVVTNSGLEPARFNAIAGALETDTALQARFQPIATRVQQEMDAGQMSGNASPAPAPTQPNTTPGQSTMTPGQPAPGTSAPTTPTPATPTTPQN